MIFLGPAGLFATPFGPTALRNMAGAMAVNGQNENANGTVKSHVTPTKHHFISKQEGLPTMYYVDSLTHDRVHRLHTRKPENRTHSPNAPPALEYSPFEKAFKAVPLSPPISTSTYPAPTPQQHSRTYTSTRDRSSAQPFRTYKRTHTLAHSTAIPRSTHDPSSTPSLHTYTAHTHTLDRTLKSILVSSYLCVGG